MECRRRAASEGADVIDIVAHEDCPEDRVYVTTPLRVSNVRLHNGRVVNDAVEFTISWDVEVQPLYCAVIDMSERRSKGKR